MKRWRIWAKDQDKEFWKGWLSASRLSKAAISRDPRPIVVDIREGPWTEEEVHGLWALLFWKLPSRDPHAGPKVASLVGLIEDNALPYADAEEIRAFLHELHYASVANSNSGTSPASNATMARQAIREICRALIGPGGAPRKRDEFEEFLSTREKRDQERDALFVLEADREARRRSKREDINLRGVIKERLDAGGDALRIEDIERETRNRRRKGEKITFANVLSERLSVHPFWNSGVNRTELLNGIAATRTFDNSTRKAIDLENRYRSFVRENNTRAKIHAALGLRKRRNKKRTGNLPIR